MRYPRYAVIPSNGRECLWDSVEAIAPQVDWVYIIYTGATASHLWDPEQKKRFPANLSLGFVGDDDPNISRWWNYGLALAEYDPARKRPRHPKWDVAVLNDDAIVPEGWFDAVAGTMRQMGVAAGCSGAHGMPVLHTQNTAPPLPTRMQGFAFILAGELGLRADEQFIWYCGDDDLGRRAAIAGGMVMVPGFHVNHMYPNQQVNDQLMSAIPEDMQRYVDKWGGRPW